ncbi:MAG: Nif3-like dinuclear metal center hexameric protein [Coriobacteriia bacterium]|nr:Nif3-like dinuclear metal center hexameric protein [Coriobacteriia bacterium]
MISEPGMTIGALSDALDARFPFATAEAWDRVGLVIGERSRVLTGVLVTLDATAEAVARAHDAGANLLLTHHPPFLEVSDVPHAGAGPAGTLEAALRLGVGVLSLHTNLDRAPAGAEALPTLLGFGCIGPLEVGTEECSLVVTYAPEDAADGVRVAMAAVGAGRLGAYEQCAFMSTGTGRFVARAEAVPEQPDPGTGIAEVRIEMVAPRDRARTVVEAARAAHPYEEPVVVATDGVRARGSARLGRVCTWHEGATVGTLAEHVSSTLGVSVRVWGEGSRSVRRIAVANGSAGSLIPTALTTADVLVAGEVRYHDALDGMSRGLAIIEAGHDMTEWPLVAVLADAVRAAAPGLPLSVETARPAWRTLEAMHDRR